MILSYTMIYSCSATAGIDWQQFRVRNGYTHGVYGSSFFACLIIVNVSVSHFTIFLIYPPIYIYK